MNYIRILSKSSLLSSNSSVKSITPSEELTKLQSEIEKLRQTVESLKLTVESRDAAIGTLAREKEKLYVELKTAQRTNRNLQQQLEDERHMHSKEKEYYMKEIETVANKNLKDELADSEKIYSNHKDTIENMIREEISSKYETICKICAKYLKIKQSKTLLLRKYKTLRNESQKACENIILLLEENKKSLDGLLRKLIEHSKVLPDNKKIYKILRHNANLHYENTQLKIRLTCSLQNIDNVGDKQNNIKTSNVIKNSSKRKCLHSNNHCIFTDVSSPYLLNKANSDTCLTFLQK